MNKGQKRRRMKESDRVNEEESSGKRYKNYKGMKSSSSSGSSDFSDFEFESQNIKGKQLDPKKTKYWKKLLNQQTEDPQHEYEQSKVKSKKSLRRSENGHRNQKKQSKAKGNEHLISFQKNQNSEKNFSHQPMAEQAKKQKSQSKDEQDEQLIKEHDKKQFNGKENAKNREKDMEILSRSRRQQREAMLNQKGTIQTKGGVSFEVDKANFVFKNKQNKKLGQKEKIKKKSKNKKRLENQFGVFDVISSNIFSKEELLKRRKQAFFYGEYARRKTFKYC